MTKKRKINALAGWLAGWLAGGLAGWLAGWLAKQFYHFISPCQIFTTLIIT
jgi:uncharacterized membrane protein YeaQ/YmgE (transglycosylase-associated protein family)